MSGPEESGEAGTRVVRRHGLVTRLSHWLWAGCLFLLFFSGLQIFNAHPILYIGQESGFDYDNSVLSIGHETGPAGAPVGVTTLFGKRFETTGVLGVSGQGELRAFPAWLTVPSYRDLATGRVVHFFFGWALFAVWVVWFATSLFNGHLRRDIVPGADDLKALPRETVDHLRLRFGRRDRYNGLQKLSYGLVLLVVFPLVFLTGLAMSPGMNAAWPWLIDVFGGRQTARTLHFVLMLALVLFFFVHLVMVLLSGPLRGIGSMITGRVRVEEDGK